MSVRQGQYTLSMKVGVRCNSLDNPFDVFYFVFFESRVVVFVVLRLKFKQPIQGKT